MKLEKQDLLDAGCENSPALETIYQSALTLSKERGIYDKTYLIKQLKKKFSSHFAVIKMQQSPAPLACAIQAVTDDEQKNLNKALKQMKNLLHAPHIRSGTLMPDACPAGNSPFTIPVGGAIAVENAIIPAAHSSDICCSLHLSLFESDYPVDHLMDCLVATTRFGPGGRTESDWVHHPVMDEPVWNNPFLRRLKNVAMMHMADQGDGNHFASIGTLTITSTLIETLRNAGQQELADKLSGHHVLKCLVTHHGSRGLGAAVYKRGLEAAVKQTRLYAKGIPDDLAWITADSEMGTEYWQALQYIQRWTKANHQSIHQGFLTSIDSPCVAELGNEHNFVWKRGSSYLHGKGATPAWQDSNGNPLLGLIPMNMSQPIFLTLGGNNSDYLSFSPHGAGRNLSRTALLKRYFHKKKGMNRLQMQADLQSSTATIDMRWYLGEADITECAVAYKDPQSVRQQIEEYRLAEVIAEIAPLGCIMAGRSPRVTKELTPKQQRQLQHRATRRKMKQRDWHGEL